MPTFPARDSVRMIEFQILKRGKWQRAEFFAGPARIADPVNVGRSFDIHYDDASAVSARPGRMTLDQSGRIVVSGLQQRWVIDSVANA